MPKKDTYTIEVKNMRLEPFKKLKSVKANKKEK